MSGNNPLSESGTDASKPKSPSSSHPIPVPVPSSSSFSSSSHSFSSSSSSSPTVPPHPHQALHYPQRRYPSCGHIVKERNQSTIYLNPHYFDRLRLRSVPAPSSTTPAQQGATGSGAGNTGLLPPHRSSSVASSGAGSSLMGFDMALNNMEAAYSSSGVRHRTSSSVTSSTGYNPFPSRPSMGGRYSVTSFRSVSEEKEEGEGGEVRELQEIHPVGESARNSHDYHPAEGEADAGSYSPRRRISLQPPSASVRAGSGEFMQGGGREGGDPSATSTLLSATGGLREGNMMGLDDDVRQPVDEKEAMALLDALRANFQDDFDIPPFYLVELETLRRRKASSMSTELQVPDGTSAAGATFSLLTVIVGSGVLNLCYALGLVGWGGLAIIVILLSLSCYTTLVLGWCADHLAGKSLRYPDISYATLGYRSGGKYFTALCVFFQALQCFAFPVMFLSTAADNMMFLTSVNSNVWRGVIFALLVPCYYLRTLRMVAWLSLFACFAIIFVVLIIYVQYFAFTRNDIYTATQCTNYLTKLFQGCDSYICTSSIYSDYVTNGNANLLEISADVNYAYDRGLTFANIVVGTGLMLFAVGGHAPMLRIKSAMANPPKFEKASFLSYLIAFILYFPLMVLSYARFGNCISSGRALSQAILFEPQSRGETLGQIGLVIHNFVAFLILINPLFRYCELIVFKIPKARKMFALPIINHVRDYVWIRIFISSLVLIVSIWLPSTVNALAFLASIFVVPVDFLFPCTVHLLLKPNRHLAKRLVDMGIIAAGILFLFLGSYYSLTQENMFSGNYDTNDA